MQTQLFVAAVEEFDPDVVHCHDLPTVNIGRELKRRRGAKFIYDSHELWAEQSLLSPVRRKLDARLERRIMRKVDGVITVNDSIAQELYSRYPSMPKPLVIRNATRPIAQPIVYDGRLHRRAGLPPDRKIVLFQGGLASGRGLETLVAAGPNFPPEWSLVFMGEGNLEQSLRKLAAQVLEKSAQPSERICFLPPVTQRYLPMWTAGASVGIIPYENVCLNNWLCSPNKLWEYPISGVPILASPFPEMSKIINEYHIGWLLDDPLTASMISEQIWSLQHAELEEAAANCREFVAADNWTIYERRLLDFYAQLSPDIGKTRGDRVSTQKAR
jgi:glycosyltransferase involved in cell wall biosynthesis